MDLEFIRDSFRLRGIKGCIQRCFGMGIQIVHHQTKFFHMGIMLINKCSEKVGPWLFRSVISASIHVDFGMIPHESAAHTRDYEYTQHCRGVRVCPPASRYAHASNNALASWRSAVSNPSVNQSYPSPSTCRASLGFPWLCQSRAKLVAARSSQDFALWAWASAMAWAKQVSASA